MWPFTAKASSSTSIDNKLSRTLITTWQDGKPLFSQTDQFAQLGQYTKWVYKCVQLISASVSSVPLRLFTSKSNGQKLIVPHKKISDYDVEWAKKNEFGYKAIRNNLDIVEVFDHPFLDLMRNVNPFMNQYDLNSLSTQYEQLVGNSFWYIVKDNLGLPSKIWVLPSEHIQIIPSRQKFIEGYKLRKANDEIVFREDEIIHFRLLTPNNPFYGRSPLSALGMSVTLENYMDKFNIDLYYNRAVPETVLQSAQELDDFTVSRVIAKWKEKFSFRHGRTGEPVVLGSGLTPFKLTMAPQDLHYIEGKKIVKKEILGVFGVPLTKIEPSKIKANNLVGDTQFLQDTIIPILSQREQKLNEKLLPMYNENIWVQYDNPIPNSKDLQLKQDIEYVQAGIKTRNEIRQSLGLPDLPVGGDDLPAFAGKIVEPVVKQPFVIEQ